MRRFGWCLLLLLFIAPAVARAAEPKCPLDVHSCLLAFDSMRHRPWLGVSVERDSVTGDAVVQSVVAGSPAERAGVRAGDRIHAIGGAAPQDWFAGRAGWKDSFQDGDTTSVAVLRGGTTLQSTLPLEHIREETLAQIIGIHMIEGHLAYDPEAKPVEQH